MTISELVQQHLLGKLMKLESLVVQCSKHPKLLSNLILFKQGIKAKDALHRAWQIGGLV